MKSMSEPRRMHPVAAISGLIAALKEFIVPLVIIYFFGRGGNQYDWMFGLILIIPFFAGIGRWFRFTYFIEGTTLKVNEGLFIRKKVTIPKNRVQSVDITAGVIQRVFGLVSVKIKTAGNETAAVDLTAIKSDEARLIVETLRGEIASGDMESGALTDENPPEVYAITMKRLLAAGATSGQIGVILSVVFTIFSQFDDMIDFDAIMRAFDQWAPFLANSTLLFALTAIIGTWVFAILGTILTYFNFTLVRREKEFVVRYGLLKTKQVSIPYNRVQAVRFSEGILRQSFGYGALYVESAGQGDERQQSSCIIAPFIHVSEVNRVLNEILPDLTLDVVVLQSPPDRAKWRYVLRLIRPVVIIVALATWLIPYGWISLVLLPLSITLGLAQYQTAGYMISDNKLLLRTRSIGRTTVLIKRGRVQSTEFKWNPLMHRRDLWSYSVTLASVGKNLVYGISYLGIEQQPDFRNWFMDGITKRHRPVQVLPVSEPDLTTIEQADEATLSAQPPAHEDSPAEFDRVPIVPRLSDSEGEAEG
jgi:putative membrane protein